MFRFFLLLTVLTVSAEAQAPSVLRGRVVTTSETPVPGANVFLLETLDGALTDSSGAFSFALRGSLPMTLLVRRLGFEPVQRVVTAADTARLTVMLVRQATNLTPITVQAGAYTAGEQRGATLTALEVVTTPGTAAEVNRAIQLLPGVQAVDDGTALFVRGGDYTETKVFLNDAGMLNPAQLLTPSGTFVGTVDPFQLDGIYFSSGGFGARYGNALSGVVALRTRGAATRSSASLGAGLAAVSGEAGWRVAAPLTVRAAVNRTNLSPFFRVNANPRGFEPAPQGHDVSASATLTWGSAGEAKLYAIDQSNRVGVPVEDPAGSGTFDSDVGSRFTVLSVRDIVGPVSLQGSVAAGWLARDEHFGDFTLAANQRQQQWFVQASWEAWPGVVLRAGGDAERVASAIAGSLPAAGPLFRYDAPGRRVGAFVEAELQRTGHLKLTPGLRVDRSTLTNTTTVDPRVAAAWRVWPLLTLTGAWGVYHQVPDPLFYDATIGQPDLPPMRSMQSVLGLQLGNDGDVFLARAEAYEKRYSDLALLSRDYQVRSEGTGASRGVDLFFKGRLPIDGMTLRSSLSVLRATRTDATTGEQAPAPFDVSVSRSVIVEKVWRTQWRAGLTWRSSTGRPYTPVASARFDSAASRFVPAFGRPNSARFPALQRLDLSMSRFWFLTPQTQCVVYASIANTLNRPNTQAWTYSADYSERTPVPSIFNRSLYFGATLIRQ